MRRPSARAPRRGCASGLVAWLAGALLGMRLRAATPDDAAAIAEIYAPYRDGERGLVRDRAAGRGGDAGADRGGRRPLSLAGRRGGGRRDPRLCLCRRASATAPAYRFTVETTVYLRARRRRPRARAAALRALLATARGAGLHPGDRRDRPAQRRQRAPPRAARLPPRRDLWAGRLQARRAGGTSACGSARSRGREAEPAASRGRCDAARAWPEALSRPG